MAIEADRADQNAHRPEIFHEIDRSGITVVEQPLTGWARLYDQGALRKTAVLVLLAVAWEVYARVLGNPLVFPTFSATVAALVSGLASGELPRAAVYTISLLL
jgi:NitT/TauT family transport system permease protein